MSSDSAPTDLEPDGRPHRLSIDFSPKVYPVPRLRAMVGYFGSEKIGGRRTHDWLAQFISQQTAATGVESLARALAGQVTGDIGLPAPRLGLFIVGPGTGGPAFWYVWNYSSMGADATYQATVSPFQVRDELGAYLSQAQQARPDLDVAMIRQQVTFQFRNGTLYPFIGVIGQLETAINSLPSLDSRFLPLTTLEGLASYTLFKLGFIKRLYSKLGYSGQPPIDGPVTTLAMDSTGLWQKHKSSFVRL